MFLLFDASPTMTALEEDPIAHIVLLLLENHSFDQMLGCFKEVYAEMEGIDSTRHNADRTGQIFLQQSSRATHVEPDPKHELADVLFQIDSNNSNFVSAYDRAYPVTSASQRAQI